MHQAQENMPYKQNVAVVGGGITGISAAIALAKSGQFKVQLFEKKDHLGGLNFYFRWQDIIWDRFYHVILSNDLYLLDFINELGLQDELFWKVTKSGFFNDGKLVSLSSIGDFIRFPFMSAFQKFRLALGILYCGKIRNPSKLDKIYVGEWLTRVFGRRVYEKIWDPLLRSKLGAARERTSAAFIWSTINRLYGARNNESKKEKMGHVYGGYYNILRTAEKKLTDLGVIINKGSSVSKITTSTKILQLNKNIKDIHDKNVHEGSQISLHTDNKILKFDKILFTIPCPEVLKLIGKINDQNYLRELKRVEYLGVICVLLILERKLSPYYVINLLDKELPFTGIIEASNVVTSEDLKGKHIVYLPKYVPEDDPINDFEDEHIIELFTEKLKKVFQNLKSSEILHQQIFRNTYVQPLQELNYLDRSIGYRTPLQGIYLANTSMIYNSTLNNNAVIKLGREAAQTILDDASNGN